MLLRRCGGAGGEASASRVAASRSFSNVVRMRVRGLYNFVVFFFVKNKNKKNNAKPHRHTFDSLAAFKRS